MTQLIYYYGNTDLEKQENISGFSVHYWVTEIWKIKINYDRLSENCISMNFTFSKNLNIFLKNQTVAKLKQQQKTFYLKHYHES